MSEKRTMWPVSMACGCNMLGLLSTCVFGDEIIIPFLVSCNVSSHLIILILSALYFCLCLVVFMLMPVDFSKYFYTSI